VARIGLTTDVCNLSVEILRSFIEDSRVKIEFSYIPRDYNSSEKVRIGTVSLDSSRFKEFQKLKILSPPKLWPQ